MRALALPLALMASAALAGTPRFEEQPAALPAPHIYAGGWEHFVGGGLAVLDCNGDGRLDLFAAGGENPAALFINETLAPGAPLAFNRGALPELTGVTGAYPLDVDSDGRLDLFVLRVGPNMLLKGGPDCRFTDAAAALGIDPGDDWTTAFSATWEPGARLPTLAIGNYVNRDDPEGPFGACADNLLIRPEGGRYAAPIPLSPGFCALSMLFSDAARRGRADLRISNDRHYYLKGGSEQIWQMPDLRLLGPEDGFEPISIWGMGIASADLTGDGLPEIALTSMGDQILQIATGPYRWENAPYETGATAHRPYTGDDGRPSTGWHAQFADVDNDGRDDLFIAKGNVDQMPGLAMHDPNNLLMQSAPLRFEEAGAEAGIASLARSRGAALADLDGDGRLDLAVVNRRAPMQIWRNVTADAGHFLSLTPRQDGTNTHAVGAFVELRLPDGEIRSREITVGGGHAGGIAGPAHFGLGRAEWAELRVIWPDGAASDWLRLPAGTRAELWREGQGLALR
ncbi:Repeat domain-containing protein [Meinhardsimonia xiamenensis]|jgi:hypothetical protein|uniref:Repeat domain-containing protein n=1 Tax=Meinhardsimonia xiamenensis TaxID=990712 RepID=A0A1G9DDJ6_9RHOB|nr:CRTAC1 family protein [Meinhardsimonia xiamenensis]PRX38030.1 VCBS repeat protein [Meinhardsimonia xiamenensis]SDK61920.1 Repeat domain-containing protein [Meinhardsimonia xiamenensis]